jgi:hypothetical protein
MTKKIKFTKRAELRLANPKRPSEYTPGELSYVKKIYEEGKTYELSVSEADRWVRRGVAHEVVAARAALPEPEAEEVLSPPAAQPGKSAKGK